MACEGPLQIPSKGMSSNTGPGPLGRQPCMSVSMQVYIVIMHCPLLLCTNHQYAPFTSSLQVVLHVQLQAKQHHCAERPLDMLAMLLRTVSKV